MDPCAPAISQESSAARLYEEGRLSAYLKASAGATSPAARFTRVRALTRKGDYLGALDELAGIGPVSSEDEALLLALKSLCHSYLGDADSARAALAAVRPKPYGTAVKFELAYAKMAIAWAKNDPDAMDRALLAIDVSSSPNLYARWLYGRSWASALRGHFAAQLSFLEQTATQLSLKNATPDIFLQATTTRAIVHLVREIYAKEAFALAVRLVETVQWHEELESERFLTFRGLAWAYALRGMHEKAFEYAYRARDIAPSDMWVTASYCDQAYLARMAGQTRVSDALLEHALLRAKSTDWTSRGEERVSLLNLAELVADHDADAAGELLAIYDAIPTTIAPALALSRDARLSAMDDYARGTVLAALGQRSAAVERLTNAYATFCTVGYAWRAAASALRIHVVTEQDAWLRYAAEAVAEFQESSVAEAIRKRAAAANVDPRISALTPAQRRVFALMCEGLGDKEIAQRLNISPETAKNHAAKVRAAFGVRSRAAVIASSRALATAV
ncbi:MAG: hypothetical protein JO263_03575 [Candidatus Eremiobacteraeota bacterium]|nr:hypothetical protein [Candidatus Eremiobacteraeota bacterium]